MDIRLFNSKTKKKEEFIEIEKGKVGIYSCGPTVYWNQHIGHMYAYVQWDLLVRFFRYLDYDVKWVMNITDVGHMTSDEDEGEDKMEKGARREGLTVWQVAEKYMDQFTESMEMLNIIKPDVLARATDHIQDQIQLIERMQKNGFTYLTKKGVVYDTGKFKDYKKFAELKLEKQKSQKNSEIDKEKKNPHDFFLWIVNPDHIMQWDSPWGRGYPGWHIECTAMSTKYLGDRFDIHTGGLEHIPVHHTNEIAQAFASFGHQTVNYWLHNAWLTLKGEKMSKSKGTFFTTSDVTEKGYDPMHLRYLLLNSHYRKGMQFDWKALDGARISYKRLLELVSAWRRSSRHSLSESKLEKIDKYRKSFGECLSDDLNCPKALSVLWKVAKSNIPNSDKYELIIEFDRVLGLKLEKGEEKQKKIKSGIIRLVEKREKFRKKGDFKKADEVRKKIEKEGFYIEDTGKGPVLKRKYF